MNDESEEKTVAGAQHLNDNLLNNVVGGVKGEDNITYFTGTFTCPLCHKEHSFKFTFGAYGFGYRIIEEASPCNKIAYLHMIDSIDSIARTGLLMLRGANETWYDNIPFTVVSTTSGDMTVFF